MTQYPDGHRKRGVVLWVMLGLLLVLTGAYVALYYVTSDRIPRGSTTVGVDVGGQTPAAAERRLAAEIAPLVARPINIVAGAERGSLNPARAGLAVDVSGTVRKAGGGRSWDPRRMWNYFLGGDNVDPVVTVDEAALDRAVEDFAKRVDVAPVEGGIVFRDGAARATYRY